MRAVRGATFIVVLIMLMMAGPSFGKDLQPLTDSDLDSIHARGFWFYPDTNTFFGGSGFSGGSTPRSPISFNLSFGGQNNFDVNNSVLMSGNAQQNAFAPVNAVNSAVNVPINIVVVKGSVAPNGINIFNLLTATNSR